MTVERFFSAIGELPAIDKLIFIGIIATITICIVESVKLRKRNEEFRADLVKGWDDVVNRSPAERAAELRELQQLALEKCKKMKKR